MKKAGVAAVIIGVVLMIGSLYVARAVKSSTVVSQIAKYVEVDVNRQNAGKLMSTIDILLNSEITGEELEELTAAKGEQAEITDKEKTNAVNARKMAQLSELFEKEYTTKQETVILRGSEKLLKNGFDFSTRLCLALHPFDQVIDVVGLLAILGGAVVIFIGGKRKIA